jgi:BTB/POZ domain-containing protein 13 (germ cell-less protein-like 1)
VWTREYITVAQRIKMFFFFFHSDKTPFLLSSQGRYLAKPYQALRLQHLLNHHIDLKILKSDNIVPPEWLNDHLYQQWNYMLQIDQSIEKGYVCYLYISSVNEQYVICLLLFRPKECDESLFDDTCVRCGRILQEEGFQKWRWTGFNYGLDLVLISDTRSLSIKRHHRTENERLLSLQVKRQFLIR